MTRINIIAASIAVSVIATHTALAQTPTQINGVPTPPPAKSVVKQAEAHANGQFTDMNRRGLVGGQIQTAWDKAKPTDGVFQIPLCDACVYRIRLRQHMVHNIELPRGEIIKKIDAGDKEEFQIEQRGDRNITIKPLGFGVDSNLLVHGKSGRIYPIYIRAESFNSVNVPDMMYRIVGTVKTKPANVGSMSVSGVGDPQDKSSTGQAISSMTTENSDQTAAVADLTSQKPSRKQGDFVKEVPFKPSQLYGWGHFKIWGGGPHANEIKNSIATIFRDDHMVYIRFKDNFELPTGYMVVDKIDELINTEVDGNTFILNAPGHRKLFTLKSGETYLCILYTGPEGA